MHGPMKDPAATHELSRSSTLVAIQTFCLTVAPAPMWTFAPQALSSPTRHQLNARIRGEGRNSRHQAIGQRAFHMEVRLILG